MRTTDEANLLILRRYRVERVGLFTYAVLCGDGTRHLFESFSKARCEQVALELRTACYDGVFIYAGLST